MSTALTNETLKSEIFITKGFEKRLSSVFGIVPNPRQQYKITLVANATVQKKKPFWLRDILIKELDRLTCLNATNVTEEKSLSASANL